MVTINQLLRKKRITKKIKLNKTPALSGSPQKYGTCLSIFNKTPRKPNSALRKVAKVRLANSKVVNVFIPGEGHNISRFSDVIVVGRRIRDLPGIKYGALRGKLDLSGVLKKRQGRSKYGAKRAKSSGEEKGKLSTPRPKSTARVFKKALVKSLRSEVRDFFRSGVFKKKSDAFSLFSKIRSYEDFRLLDFSYSRKDARVERNAQPGMILKKRSLKETIRETYKMVSDARKYKSLKGQDSTDSVSSPDKPLRANFGPSLSAGGRFFTLLEVSQSLKFIRVLDSETKRVLRYSL